MPAAFTGQLNPNEIFSSIYNMIISQTVQIPELANNYALVDKFKVDGSLYGDEKLFYAMDVLDTQPWTGDSEAANLLNLNRPDDPKCQKIVLDQFRMVFTTLDEYLSKRAWSTEGAFSQFNGIVLSLLRKTKRVYEVTLFNTYVGTTVSNATRSIVEVPLSNITETGEEKNRLEAETIAQYIADLLVEMKDYSRDFNDYKFLRGYTESELMFIWNSKYINKIRKLDLPTIFHKEGLMDKFTEDVLPSRFFGEVITASNIASYSDATPTTNKPINSSTGAYTPGNAHANGTLRSLIETSVTVSGTKYKLFPGDELPSGATVGASKQFAPGTVYFELADVICKVVTKDTYKQMSAFEVATSFWNPRAINNNHYLIWGYSNPDRLLDQPLITVTAD